MRSNGLINPRGGWDFGRETFLGRSCLVLSFVRPAPVLGGARGTAMPARREGVRAWGG